MREASQPAVVGLFVGGKARRMGGAAKALLPAPGTGEPLAARLLRIAAQVGLSVVIVGAVSDDALPPSAAVLPRLADVPAGVGPLGGLGALLAHAGNRPAIALACDMPYVSAELLHKLASTPCESAVLAARDPASGKWQSLFARYSPALVLPSLHDALAQHERSFQAVLARVDCRELALSSDECAQLRDWDCPADIER